ncbi:calcium-binding protein [Aureimonas sp. AU40]|uniref:calcium-binding protein n=1 Tax=Aureimonas sp. AU40 TaxID=1637747 RepID=UPI0007820E6C|nr:hypothetical protein [Aureimonas sp. AU40]
MYSSSEAAALHSLSQEATDRINRVLSDIGLAGTSHVAIQSIGSDQVAADSGDAVMVVIPGDSKDVAVDDSGANVSVIMSDHGTIHLTGLGNDTIFGSDGGDTITAGGGDATIHGGLGADSLSGGSIGGSHVIYGGGGHDTLLGGNGMDTLWAGTDGSYLEGGAKGHTEMHAGGGGDTIRSTGDYDTIHGGVATINTYGDHTLIHADGDTIGSHGAYDTIDASGSHRASTIDAYGHHATIQGGDGNDTIMLHDDKTGYSYVDGGAGNDSIIGSKGGHATLSGGAGDDYLMAYGVGDSVMGGDGSDYFQIVHYGTGHDTLDGGAGSNTVNFADRHFSDAHISTSDHTTIVSFDDGYKASITHVDQLRFSDTVYNITNV